MQSLWCVARSSKWGRTSVSIHCVSFVTTHKNRANSGSCCCYAITLAQKTDLQQQVQALLRPAGDEKEARRPQILLA